MYIGKIMFKGKYIIFIDTSCPYNLKTRSTVALFNSKEFDGKK